MKPYADSNFFTRLYLRLPDSGSANRLLAEQAQEVERPLGITWLHRLEVVNAFQQQVYAGLRSGQPRITAEQAVIAQARFREDLERANFLRPISLDQARLLGEFEDISLRHTARYGFRAYDVVHVASAHLLGCDTFWSFDEKACRLAKLEGLKLPKR